METNKIKKLFTINWNYNDNSQDTQISILDFIDQNPNKFREKFCNFNYKISNFKIFNKNFNDICKDSKGYNYWQMSNIFEKSFYKSKHINDLIKIFALEDLILKEKPTHLQINNLNPVIYDSVKQLCLDKNIILINKKIFKKKSFKNFIKTTFIFSFYYIFKQYLLFNNFKTEKLINNINKNSTKKKILIFSYLINLEKNYLDNNIFYSYNWRDLPKILLNSKYYISWFHHYTKTDIFKNKKDTIKILSSLNKNKKINGMHTLLYEYFNFFTFLKIIFKFLYLRIYFLFFTILINFFYFDKNNNDKFWKIIKNNWYESFCGVELIKNILWIELFEKLFKFNKDFECCLYLFENQSWEKALINAYRRYNNNNIIGYLHHTARFWDTRLYFHKDEVNNLTNSYLIMPNKIAVSGNKAKLSLIDSGYDPSSLIEVEAIRYLSLNNVNINNFTKIDHLIAPNKILLLGGYINEINYSLLDELLKIDKFKLNADFYIKFHPGCLLNLNRYKNLNLKIINNNLSDIINDYNSIIISGDSSASIESFFSNINTIVFMNSSTLNFNPLYGNSNIKFVTNSNDIYKALSEKNDIDNSKDLNNFLWLDDNLKKWKKLLC